MLLSPNFSNLTNEGYAAFILAIIFSIITLASFFFFAKHKQINKILLIVVTFVLPFLTIFCWIYLILNILQYSTLTNFGISAAVSVGYIVIALLITLTFNYTDKQKDSNVEVKDEAEVAPMLIEHNPQSKEEVVEHEENVSEDEEKPENIEGVVFSNEEKKTFAEQLETLTYETRKAYEEILAYAQQQAGTKTKDSKYHVTVSVGRMKLVQFKFNRGSLISSFMAGSSELKNYSASEKNVKIKEKPVVVEVENEDSVTVAKNMVDIVYKNIADAKEDLKESKKAARKAKKQAEAEIAEAPVEKVESPVEEAQKRRGRRKKAEEVEASETEETTVEEEPKKRRGRKKKEKTENSEENQGE